LAACSTQPVSQWEKSGQPTSQRDQDLAQCKYEAEKATASSGDGRLPKSTNEAVNKGVERGLEQADLIKSCMKARGYAPK